MATFFVKYSKNRVEQTAVVSADDRTEAQDMVRKAVGDVVFISSTSVLPHGTVANLFDSRGRSIA